LPVILRQFRQYLLIGRLQGVPRLPVHHAVHWQTVDPLEGVYRIQQLLIEVVGQRDHGQFRQKVPQKRQIEPHRPHVDAAVSQPQLLGVPPLHLGDGESLAAEFRQLLDAVVDLLDLVPCGLAHDAVLRQIEDLLKDPHRLLHVLVKDEAVVQRRDGGVVLPDAVELPLQGLHVVAGVAPPQGPPRIGGHVPAYRRIHHQIDVATVVVLQNFVGRHALLRQIHAAPLGQATAPGTHPVAELGEQRLHAALPHDIVVENIVHDAADILEYVAVLHIGLIVPGGGGDVEVVPSGPVILRVHPVQGVGDLGQNVGSDGTLRPGRINFVGGHVLDVLGEGYHHVPGGLPRRPQMHRDGLRHHGIGIGHHARSFLTPLAPASPAGWSPLRRIPSPSGQPPAGTWDAVPTPDSPAR
jgi:hypothetical protein